jgi:nitrate reductase gamma subunit
MTATATLTPTRALAPTVQASTPNAPSTSSGSTTPPSSGTDWPSVLRFARGPLFQACLIVFLVGMVYRLIQALRPGWKHQRATRKPARASAIAQSFAQGLIIFPYIPQVRSAFKRSAVTYIAGGLFHVGLFGVIFLSNTHMQVWKSLIGIGWPVLPQAAVGWLSVIGIVSMVALLIHRIVNPVLKLLSGLADYLNWLLVFLPMITGFLMTHQLWQPYEMAYSIHMLTVDALLVWIPLSRISHFMFYFFSRTIHGLEFGARSAQS